MWQRGQWLAWTTRFSALERGLIFQVEPPPKTNHRAVLRIRADASMNVKALPGSENDPKTSDRNKRIGENS
jgi:hypothetical protein